MLNRYPCVMQQDASDCAAACLSTILKYYNVEMPIMKLREILGTDLYGTTVKGILNSLEYFKFKAKAMRTEIDMLNTEITLPAIVQIMTSEGRLHYVVLHRITHKDIFIVADPAKGVNKIKRKSFEQEFTGVMILMVPCSNFEKLKYKSSNMVDLFLSLILPQRKLVFTILLISLVLSVVGIILSTSSKVLMDELIPYRLKSSMFVFALAFGIITVIHSILNSFRQHIILYLSRKVDLPILMGYYNHIMHLSYNFFVNRKIGDIITRFQDAMTIKSIFTNASISLVLDIGLSFISALILWNMNSSLFIILLVMVIVNIILVYIFKQPYKNINYEQMESSAKVNSHIIDSIRNIETLKSQNDENYQIEKLENKYVNLLKIEFKEGVLKNIQGLISSLISTVGNLLFMCTGAIFIMDGKMSIGDLLVFQSMSQYFTGPVQSIVSLQLTYQEAQIAMKRLNEVMELEREDSSHKLNSKLDLRGDVEFKNITFSYGSRPPIIKKLNLKIKKGEKIAIIGETGSGKSTLAKLLLKFMDINEGSITISGCEIADIDNYYLRKKVAYIPQSIELFTGTILENILIGNHDASYESVIIACKKSGAHSFISKMPNRYESYVEEGGANLSGGEKQRLAIARALLSEPDFYIFDEATSHLDAFSEKEIEKLIFDQIENRTTIIIAHRLSTIEKCDYICLMEAGKIIEKGTHIQLLKSSRKYAEMINMQSNTANNKKKEKVEGDIIKYE